MICWPGPGGQKNQPGTDSIFDKVMDRMANSVGHPGHPGMVIFDDGEHGVI